MVQTGSEIAARNARHHVPPRRGHSGVLRHLSAVIWSAKNKVGRVFANGQSSPPAARKKAVCSMRQAVRDRIRRRTAVKSFVDPFGGSSALYERHIDPERGCASRPSSTVPGAAGGVVVMAKSRCRTRFECWNGPSCLRKAGAMIDAELLGPAAGTAFRAVANHCPHPPSRSGLLARLPSQWNRSPAAEDQARHAASQEKPSTPARFGSQASCHHTLSSMGQETLTGAGVTPSSATPVAVHIAATRPPTMSISVLVAPTIRGATLRI